MICGGTVGAAAANCGSDTNSGNFLRHSAQVHGNVHLLSHAKPPSCVREIEAQKMDCLARFWNHGGFAGLQLPA